MKPRPATRRAGPSGTELVEEAVHLLRRAPLPAWLAYLAGAAPWVACICYLWARAGWFAPGPGERTFAALLLVALFASLKAGQAVFCAHLLALRHAAPPPRFTVRRWASVAADQLRLQAWGLLAIPLAAIVAAPFGWIFAFYQNATVLGADPSDPGPRCRTAWTFAEAEPGQNHLGLVWLQLLGIVVWLNLAAAFYALPWLATRYLGFEGTFALHGFAVLNTTFLAIVTSLAWLVVDPLVKAFYALRVFHLRAQKTGDDLRCGLAALHAPRVGRTTAAAVLVVLLLLAGTPQGARADGPAAPPAPPAATAELDEVIDRVLAEPDFAWSLRPPPPAATDTDRGPIGTFFAECGASILRALRSVGRIVDNLVRWLDSLFGGGRSADSTNSGPHGMVKILLYALLVAACLGLVWLGLQFWRRARRRDRVPVRTAEAAPPAAPDLRDEAVQASQLPTDGWLELARRRMEAGDWRLALRALYLALLAHRAAEGLLVLARSKTNLDYERELGRRALSRRELVEHFRSRRRTFEEVWYGRAVASETLVRDWFDELASAPARP